MIIAGPHKHLIESGAHFSLMSGPAATAHKPQLGVTMRML